MRHVLACLTLFSVGLLASACVPSVKGSGESSTDSDGSSPTLMPGFAEALDQQDGCGNSGFWLGAQASGDGDLLLSLSVSLSLLDEVNSSGQSRTETLILPSEDVSVSVSMGPQIASDLCNDAPYGTLERRYEAESGTVQLEISPLEGSQGVVTATLSGLQLADDGDPNAPTVTLDEYRFDAVEVWCCPG
jgi:hypothetical protein